MILGEEKIVNGSIELIIMENYSGVIRKKNNEPIASRNTYNGKMDIGLKGLLIGILIPLKSKH